MSYEFYTRYGSQYLKHDGGRFIWSPMFQQWLGFNDDSTRYLGMWVMDDYGDLVRIRRL